jgi:spermidine synthase
LLIKANLNISNENEIISSRNFYGVVSVKETYIDTPKLHRRVLLHGRIEHGIQLLSDTKRTKPTSDYGERSGLGKLMKNYPRDNPIRIGVLGLGAGTIAAYGRQGDHFKFNEINPQIVDLAQNYFSYLADSAATIDIVMGGARLSLEKEPDQEFGILVLDVFSGDSVPVHLLTEEAFFVYRRHLKAGGVIVANIANKYLDLHSLLVVIAKSFDMESRTILNTAFSRPSISSSKWLLMSNNKQFLTKREFLAYDDDAETVKEDLRMSTDQYSNLFDIFIWDDVESPREIIIPSCRHFCPSSHVLSRVTYTGHVIFNTH